MAKRDFDEMMGPVCVPSAEYPFTEVDLLIGERAEIKAEIAELRVDVAEADDPWFADWLNMLLRKAEMRKELNSFDLNMLINKCLI